MKPPIARFGRYQLLDRLGAGGMAEVFRARADGAVADVAIKRILPELADLPEFGDMLLTEARLSAQLQHPAIVQVLDFGEIERSYYLELELVEGCNLRQLQNLCAKRGKSLPPSLVCHVVAQVASALAYAHARTDEDGDPLGIVHRDVSPSNIMVSPGGGVKLLDFGIAKAASMVGDERTRTGMLKGKLSYMSPEQARAQPLDRRSDIFSLGIVLHECLTAARLFKGSGDLETLELVRKAEVRPPSQLAPGLDPALDGIVLKMLAARPAERFADCEAVATALAPHARVPSGGRAGLQSFVADVDPLPAREPATQSQGSVGAQELAPGVILFKMSGFLDTSFVQRFEQVVAPMAARGLELELFFDTESMTGDHPDFRGRMTEWHNALKPLTRGLHVLVRSKLVAMSIAFVNMLTGGMLKVYSNRVAFEAALRAAVRRSRAAQTG